MKQNSLVLPSQNPAQILGLSIKYQSSVCGLIKYSSASLNNPVVKTITAALKQMNTRTHVYLLIIIIIIIIIIL
jgi:hypothetical protein